MDSGFLHQAVQRSFQIQVATAQKIAIDIGRGRHTEGSNGPLGTFALGLFFRQRLPFHPAREELFGQSPDIPVPIVADDHHLSLHLQVEEHGGKIAPEAPSVRASLASGVIPEFIQLERPPLEFSQDFLP